MMPMKSKKSAKGMIPAGYANGGKAMPFKGKDDPKEEMAEGKEVASGKVSAKQYVRKEMAEGRKNEDHSPAELKATGSALASGKMTPKQYAGMAEKKADGGMAGGCSSAGYGSSLNGKHMGK